MDKTGKEEENDSFWAEGFVAETMSAEQIKKKMRTFHMKHDEEMNFNCKKCNEKISAHNEDWHQRLCDACYNNSFH